MTIKQLAIAALAASALAAAPAAARQVAVEVTPDPHLAAVEQETGDDHDPYVQFGLRRATAGWRYRIVVQKAPAHRADRPCNAGLYTKWQAAGGDGKVAFPLAPVSSGTYLPFAGNEPCHGHYVMKVHGRAAGSNGWSTVRRFAFDYPSFRSETLPTRG